MNSRQRYRMRRMAEHNAAKSERQSYINRIDTAFTRLSEGCSKRVVRAVAASEDKSTQDYRQQLESRSEAIERSHRRIAYKDVNPLGNKIHAVQKLKLSSKPLI